MNNQNEDSQQQAQQFQQQKNYQEIKLDPEDIIQNKILQNQQKKQRLRQKASILSQDVQFKLEEVLEEIKQNDGQDFQTIIQLRMKQLSYNKILVLTYEKSYFRLVAAHFHIGKQYLKFDCFQQALHHLSNAINQNIPRSENTQNQNRRQKMLYNSYINTYIGQCFFKIRNYEKSINELRGVINLHSQLQQQESRHINNIKAFTYLAKSLSELNNNQAQGIIEKAVSKAKIIQKENSKVYALTLYEQAKIFIKFSKKDLAIELYLKIIQILKNCNESDVQLDLIKCYQELCQIYQNSRQIQKYFLVLKAKYEVYENTYGNSDKKSIKEQRSYATALLKYKQFDQSLQQFQDILEKEQKVFGENSLEVGKQFKSIGNIYIAKNEIKLAQTNFKKAMKIFHDLGDQRLAREVRMKLSSLQIQLLS